MFPVAAGVAGSGPDAVVWEDFAELLTVGGLAFLGTELSALVSDVGAVVEAD
jgi:hypothetical protein